MRRMMRVYIKLARELHSHVALYQPTCRKINPGRVDFAMTEQTLPINISKTKYLDRGRLREPKADSSMCNRRQSGEAHGERASSIRAVDRPSVGRSNVRPDGRIGFVLWQVVVFEEAGDEPKGGQHPSCFCTK